MLDDEEDMIEKYGKMIVLARKQKDTSKEGNFVFVTESGKSDTFSFLPAILPYEPDTRVSTLMEETQSCFDVLQSTKIEYGLFIPQDTASKGYYLDLNKTMEDHNLKGQIYIEFTMRNFTVNVKNMVSEEEKEFTLHPSSEVAKIIRYVLNDFNTMTPTNQMDKYGLYIPPPSEGPKSGQLFDDQLGTLMDNTKKLSSYLGAILTSGAVRSNRGEGVTMSGMPSHQTEGRDAERPTAGRQDDHVPLHSRCTDQDGQGDHSQDDTEERLPRRVGSLHHLHASHHEFLQCHEESDLPHVIGRGDGHREERD